MPGVRAFCWPALTGLQKCAPGADHGLTAQFLIRDRVLAGAVTQPSGIPESSTSTDRLVPCLPRSTGDFPPA